MGLSNLMDEDKGCSQINMEHSLLFLYMSS